MKAKNLLFTVVMTFIVISATAQTWNCGTNVTATLNNGTLTVSGTGAMTNYTSYSSVPWYSVNSQIKQVVVSSGVTGIGDYAFAGCTGLTSVIIPDNVTKIGRYIFQDCSGLTELTLPFVGVSATATVSTAILGALFGTTSNSDMQAVTQRYSLSNSFSCYLPKNLKKVTVTSPCSTLSFGAFSYCNMLEEIVLPRSLTSIATWAFLNCSGLTSITIPANVTSVDPTAFLYCSSLTSIEVASENTNYSSFDGVLFNKDKSTLIKLPCGKTGNYIIPDGVLTIGDGSFNTCKTLTSVSILNSVTSINDYAFNNCTGLVSIACLNPDPATITMGRGVFDYVDTIKCSLTIPTGSVALYRNASTWKNFHTITEGGDLIPNLTNLTVSAGTLSPAFNSNVFVYHDTVPQNVANITLTVSPIIGGTVSGAGQKTLNFGDNTFDITVTSAQGTSVYTVIVNRIVDTYLLTDLTVSAGTLSPVFKADSFVYKVTVPVSVANIVLTATPIVGATVSGDGKKALIMGDNTFEITVTSPTLGSFVYTVTVTRATSDILLQLIKVDEITSGATYSMHNGVKYYLVDQYKVNYRLTTGKVSGNLPLHFDVRSGEVTYDTIINVSAYSVYNITLNLSGITYGQYDILFITTVYGTNMSISRHAGDVIASNGSDILSTTNINFAGSGFTNISLSDPALISSYTAIENVPSTKTIAVFPNPAVDQLTVSGLQSGEMLYIYNVSGQQLLFRKATGGTEQFTVSHFPSGIYFVKTSNSQALKWIKK